MSGKIFIPARLLPLCLQRVSLHEIEYSGKALSLHEKPLAEIIMEESLRERAERAIKRMME